MPQTYAVKKKKYIENLKAKGLYDDFKKKKAEQEKARRARQKESLNELTNCKKEQKIAENRIKCRKRVQLYRQRKKQAIAEVNQTSTSTSIASLVEPTSFTSSLNVPATTLTSLSSNVKSTYNTKSAGYKAVSKTKKTLPVSPSKRNFVIAKLFDSLPSKDKEEIMGNRQKVNLKPSWKRLKSDVIEAIKEFYQRDDISRMSPNVKDARYFKNNITGVKELKQIRHLMHKLKKVYALYVEDYRGSNNNRNPPVKKSKFYALRPKHVKLVGSTPRNVCLCHYHANFHECCASLHKNLPEFPVYDDVTKFLLCENATKDCWFKTCKKCSRTKIDKKLQGLITSLNECKKVTCMLWKKDVTTNRTQKYEEEGTLKKLMDFFLTIYPPFLIHKYIHREQAKNFNNDRKGIYMAENVDEALLQVDFAENYKCKFQDEIQQAHYNQQQISLFTTALHHRAKLHCEVIISDNTHHSKETLIAYLYEIFSKLPSTVKKVKLWSDGPSSQFKNKYIAAVIPLFEKKFKVKIFWNFFATAHAKGTPDGIGAAVKKRVKRLILSRKRVVTCSKDFVNSFYADNEADDVSKVSVVELNSEGINKINKSLRLDNIFASARPLNKISSYHQLLAVNDIVYGFTTSDEGYNMKNIESKKVKIVRRKK